MRYPNTFLNPGSVYGRTLVRSYPLKSVIFRDLDFEAHDAMVSSDVVFLGFVPPPHRDVQYGTKSEKNVFAQNIAIIPLKIRHFSRF